MEGITGPILRASRPFFPQQKAVAQRILTKIKESLRVKGSSLGDFSELCYCVVGPCKYNTLFGLPRLTAPTKLRHP